MTFLTTALLGLVAAGCRDKPVPVAAVLPLSGEYQVYGESSRKGLELALAELQAAVDPAVLVELEIVDSGSDPERAGQLLAASYKDGALVAIGGVTSREAEAMVPVAEKLDRVLLSPSAANARLSDESRQFYRLAPSDFTAGTTMAGFAARELGLKSVAVVAEDESLLPGLREGFVPTFEANGGEVVAVLELPAAAEERDQVLAELRAQNPDAVHVSGYQAAIAETIRTLRAHGYKGQILTTEAFASPTAIRQLGDAAEGVLLTRTVLAEGDAHVQGFIERYRQKYGEEPDVFAAEGYDALMVLATALADRPALPGEVRKGLRDAVKGYAGVTGNIEFAGTSVTKYPRVYSVAADLSLRDHGDVLEERRRAILERKRALEQQLQQIRQEAATTAVSSS